MKYRISVEIDHKDGWRYYAIFDRKAPTGPFTADLIEYYTHICHDMIDMDVSNLYIKRNYNKDLGMRIPLNNVKILENNVSINIKLENVVQSCLDKQFKCLRTGIDERVDKMQ